MSSTPPVNATVVNIASIDPSATVTAPVTTTPVRPGARGVGGERFGAGKRVLLSIARGSKGVAGTMAGTLGTIAVWGADLTNPLTGLPLGNAYAAAASPTTQLFSGDGSTVAFQTNIPYVAFSNYNWIVETEKFKFTGTFTISAAGVITGSSTLLTTEAAVGDTIVVAGRVYQIATITSATAGTVTAATLGVAATAGSTGYNLAQRARMCTYAASPAGPRQYSVTNVGGFALITFAVAPPASLPTGVLVPGSQDTAIAVYFVVPSQILADGAHVNERVGVRSYSAVWTIYTGDGGDDFDSAVVNLEHAVG